MSGQVVGGVQLEPGTVLVVPEPDYLYGLGTVTVVVKDVVRVFEQSGSEWVELSARQALAYGAGADRIISVRVGALQQAARAGQVSR